MWYYLSLSDSLEPAITEVRQPIMAYQESTEPRLCVAPTVTECVLALASQTGMFYIYIVDVTDPVSPDDTVFDQVFTSERWITQQVLDRHGGSIVIRLLGTLKIDQNLRTNLKVPVLRGKLPTGWQSRESNLWEVNNGIWEPKFLGPSEVMALLK